MAEPVRLVVAQVRGLHGLNGAVRVEVLTDRPEERFAAGNVLHVEADPRPLTIAAAEAVEDGPGWRLRFREVPTRNAAEWLREAYLEIAVDRATDLDSGAAYWHEVVGAVVRDSTGAELGRVADVYRAGENEVYVVRGGPSGEFDLPAVRDVITSFAPERGEIVVDEQVLDLGGAVVDAPEKTSGSRATRRRPRWSRHGKGAAKPSAPADAPPPSEPPAPAEPPPSEPPPATEPE
ncbi:MAG TPA: ribosome maturation factor RimM [Candidatus Limnocylindrales bacterium]|nr:ribosome maturation factor RimM [Candidatus Limnocylindrales bacterium]